jgi:hypothetical protein
LLCRQDVTQPLDSVAILVKKVEQVRNYDDLVRCVPWELFAALFFLVCGLMAQSGHAQSQEDNSPETNPSRPTVSTPATLTGWLLAI